MFDSLQPHESQHARPPCPSPIPGACSNSCPLSQWCHPTISSSVVTFSSCPQSFPASGSFQMSQLFASGGQSFSGVSASVLPKNTQDWSPLGWTGWISLQSNGFSRVFSNITVQSINYLALSFLYSPTLYHGNSGQNNHPLSPRLLKETPVWWICHYSYLSIVYYAHMFQNDHFKVHHSIYSKLAMAFQLSWSTVCVICTLLLCDQRLHCCVCFLLFSSQPLSGSLCKTHLCLTISAFLVRLCVSRSGSFVC